MNLIVPMAGRSSRFPGVRPKWMLTHPNGQFMAIAAIGGFNLSSFDKIYFVYLKEHQDEFKFLKGFTEELEEIGIGHQCVMVELPEPTIDQSETVLQAIVRENITGPIVIKDADNFFSASFDGSNGICYSDLNSVGLIKPNNKSYILMDDFGKITNIIEKQVISPFFCVGAYAFESAELFRQSLEKLPFQGERYISNVIYQAILDEHSFNAIPVKYYSDWGTLQDWNNYRRGFATLFIDFDGVISQHSASHFPPYYGETSAITENVAVLKELRNSGKFQVVITTARPKKYQSVTEQQLKEFGLEYDYLLMGMQHSKRIIINDYSSSNPYKSCDAINLKRNSTELKDLLRDSLGVDYDDI